ncbi:hypothetical protein IJ847_02145 [Candidatus Saccharibacteria bacterium]|nr:hypothetical protein [Candidatus Saccharibacteria bacterium]
MNRAKIDEVMNQIQYGWVDKDGGRHEELTGFSASYALQLADELQESKLGVCWDQVELERKLFAEQGIKARAFFIVYYDDGRCPTHTFVLVEDGDKVVWYEHAWEFKRGWHEFDNLYDALREVRKNFIDVELHNDFEPQNLCIYQYSAPTEKLSCIDFYHHCEAGESFNDKL